MRTKRATELKPGDKIVVDHRGTVQTVIARPKVDRNGIVQITTGNGDIITPNPVNVKVVD